MVEGKVNSKVWGYDVGLHSFSCIVLIDFCDVGM